MPGAGRFSDRPNRTPASPAVPVAAADTAGNGEVRTLPYEARCLVAFVNRIAAHGGLTVWESGADVETAQKTDKMFRFLMMDASAELLTDIEARAPEVSPGQMRRFGATNTWLRSTDGSRGRRSGGGH